MSTESPSSRAVFGLCAALLVVLFFVGLLGAGFCLGMLPDGPRGFQALFAVLFPWTAFGVVFGLGIGAKWL